MVQYNTSLKNEMCKDVFNEAFKTGSTQVHNNAGNI
jgi:hypothetical protein